MQQRFWISDQPIDSAGLEAQLADRRAGACASFAGWVRDHNDGRSVDRLEYEAFAPLCVSEAEAILDEARDRFAILDARAVHRVGTLQIGDAAVWVGAIASHRDEAFRACRYIIDEIKARLPVWKKEHYRNGEAIWVNCQRAPAPKPAAGGGPGFAEDALYTRQVRLAEIGAAGQAKLKAARVLVVGMGGLGSAAAPALAAAGIGTLGLVENDLLDASNLHRQLLYSAADIGQPKALLAADRLRQLNPFVEVRVHSDRLGEANAADILDGYDLVLDCTDNFQTKYLLNDAAHLLRIPVIQASLYQYEGQLHVYDPAGTGGCLRCLFPEPPPEGAVGNCADVGVLGVVPQLFGTLQANEVLKRLLGLPGQMDRSLLLFDLQSLETQRLARPRRDDCALCGAHPTITELRRTEAAPAPALDLEIDLAAADPALLQRARWVDLREPEERGSPVPAGTVLVPFGAFDAAAPGFASDAPVLLFCAAGRRSLRAAQMLRGRGWTDIWSVRGGADAVRGFAA